MTKKFKEKEYADHAFSVSKAFDSIKDIYAILYRYIEPLARQFDSIPEIYLLNIEINPKCSERGFSLDRLLIQTYKHLNGVGTETSSHDRGQRRPIFTRLEVT